MNLAPREGEGGGGGETFGKEEGTFGGQDPDASDGKRADHPKCLRYGKKKSENTNKHLVPAGDVVFVTCSSLKKVIRFTLHLF